MPRLVFLALAAVVASASAAFCVGGPDPHAPPNTLAIATGEPVLKRAIDNAKLFSVGEKEDTLHILHLWGSPYEKGLAQGTIMKEECQVFTQDIWNYIVEQAESAINGSEHNLKPWFVELVVDFGLDIALEMTEAATRPFTGKYFYEELQGIADGCDVSLQRLINIHMIGELTRGSCSMYGAWGKATPDGNLMQLRALDWDVAGPFQNFPQITVYHPRDASDGNTFANIGWTIWIGSITGMSAEKMAISEIGVSNPDATFGNMSRVGVPFTFLLRDILQFDTSLQQSLDRISNANRTCDLILGVGDGKLSTGGGFRGVQYSHSVANFYSDKNNHPVAKWHPDIKDVVYYGMDWLCPKWMATMAQNITAHYGSVTAETTIRNIAPAAQTGDLHVAVYDLHNGILHTANARKANGTGPLPAYMRQYVRIDMNKQWALQQD